MQNQNSTYDAGPVGIDCDADAQKIKVPHTAQAPCEPCKPTQPECGKCEFAAAPRPAQKTTWRKVIAVDFDGCLCANAWPEIGAPNLDVIEKLQLAQADGAAVILWTNRTGEMLAAAVNWAQRHGITFDAVNENLPEWQQHFGSDPRKIGASEYWDDKAVRMPPDALDAGQATLHHALYYYGVGAQVDKCIEEMAELTKALLKERYAAMADRPAARKNIFEEMADVYIMLAQMRITYEVSGTEVAGWQASKIAQLEKRLTEEEETNA